MSQPSTAKGRSKRGLKRYIRSATQKFPLVLLQSDVQIVNEAAELLHLEPALLLADLIHDRLMAGLQSDIKKFHEEEVADSESANTPLAQAIVAASTTKYPVTEKPQLPNAPVPLLSVATPQSTTSSPEARAAAKSTLLDRLDALMPPVANPSTPTSLAKRPPTNPSTESLPTQPPDPHRNE